MQPPLKYHKQNDGSIPLTVKAHRAYFMECEFAVGSGREIDAHALWLYNEQENTQIVLGR